MSIQKTVLLTRTFERIKAAVKEAESKISPAK